MYLYYLCDALRHYPSRVHCLVGMGISNYYQKVSFHIFVFQSGFQDPLALSGPDADTSVV